MIYVVKGVIKFNEILEYLSLVLPTKEFEIYLKMVDIQMFKFVTEEIWNTILGYCVVEPVIQVKKL